MVVTLLGMVRLVSLSAHERPLSDGGQFAAEGQARQVLRRGCLEGVVADAGDLVGDSDACDLVVVVERVRPDCLQFAAERKSREVCSAFECGTSDAGDAVRDGDTRQ